MTTWRPEAGDAGWLAYHHEHIVKCEYLGEDAYDGDGDCRHTRSRYYRILDMPIGEGPFETSWDLVPGYILEDRDGDSFFQTADEAKLCCKESVLMWIKRHEQDAEDYRKRLAAWE